MFVVLYLHTCGIHVFCYIYTYVLYSIYIYVQHIQQNMFCQINIYVLRYTCTHVASMCHVIFTYMCEIMFTYMCHIVFTYMCEIIFTYMCHVIFTYMCHVMYISHTSMQNVFPYANTTQQYKRLASHFASSVQHM